MKKNMPFEKWVADQLMTGMIMMEPYGYREDEPGKYLHIFKIMLKFENAPEPFEGIAFIPIPFDGGTGAISDFTFDEESLDFTEDFINYD